MTSDRCGSPAQCASRHVTGFSQFEPNSSRSTVYAINSEPANGQSRKSVRDHSLAENKWGKEWQWCTDRASPNEQALLPHIHCPCDVSRVRAAKLMCRWGRAKLPPPPNTTRDNNARHDCATATALRQTAAAQRPRRSQCRYQCHSLYRLH
jgi:hypothetical protein